MTGKAGKRLLLAIILLCALWMGAAAQEESLGQAAFQPASTEIVLVAGERILLAQETSASYTA